VSDRSGSEVDRQTVARLTGAARRHARCLESTEAETAAAVAELREIAGDRGDLLAEVAGLLIGFYRRTVEDLQAQAAAGYCIAAGADLDLIPRWIEVGRSRGAASRQVRPTAAPDENVRLSTFRTGSEPFRGRDVPRDARSLSAKISR
jgi:hypothetical protein